MYRNIGLIGHARVGKDTVAARLRMRCGYQRVAFADVLKTAALRVNPIIPTAYGIHVRLSKLVADTGWEFAKAYPEVRRFLQEYGQTVREVDPMFWVHAAWPSVDAAKNLGLPVVVTDVRYRNEAVALKADGFVLIRVTRPGVELSGPAGQHASETELDGLGVALTISNSGSLADLHSIVDNLLLPR